MIPLFKGSLFVSLHPLLGFHQFTFFKAFPEFWLVCFDAGAVTFGGEADFGFAGEEIFEAAVTISGNPLESFHPYCTENLSVGGCVVIVFFIGFVTGWDKKGGGPYSFPSE